MSEITNAIKQICEEKGLSYESVMETIESALAAAYRKDFGEKNQNIKVEFDPETGKSKIYDVKSVVEDLPEVEEGVLEAEAKQSDNMEKKEEITAGETEGEEERKFNPKTEIQLGDAILIKKGSKLGDEIRITLDAPEAYGRVAAQTAKQVIIQKLREAERDLVFSDFKKKENEVIVGVVQRREGRTVLVDLDKVIGYLPSEEQIQNERYSAGDRVKVYVKSVNLTSKGPEIILSRTSEEILKKVFYLEIPEISNGLVEIKGVAREAGNRSKVAVLATSENVDPIGSCVGQRGARIQTIISELGGEKIDIIEYDDEPAKFITNALAPAKVLSVTVLSDNKALIKVAEDQLSLAIGRDGQNVRLAAKLTGWRLDIVGERNVQAEVPVVETQSAEKDNEVALEEAEAITPADDKPEEKTKKTVKKKSKKE